MSYFAVACLCFVAFGVGFIAANSFEGARKKRIQSYKSVANNWPQPWDSDPLEWIDEIAAKDDARFYLVDCPK